MLLKRLLIVDDNATMRKAVQSLLVGSGEVEVVGMASNGEEALSAVRALRPDIMILDAIMPVLDGFGVLAALKKEPYQPKVVMLSLWEGAFATHRAIAEGAAAYVSKSRAHRDLLPVIRAV